MKTLLENKTSRKLGVDHIIKAVLLDVGSPPPSEPEKQPIVLCLPPGDIKMGCNIIGSHLHINPAEKGNTIWITSKKEGACYVSYFPDEDKHFLTIRDGVRFDFRPLAPGTKMHSPTDRLPYLADHYRKCWDHAAVVMVGTAGADLTAIATALWIETKAGVLVPKVTTSEPKGKEAPSPDKDPEPEKGDPVPAPDPPPYGKPPEELPEVKEVNIQVAYGELAKMDYSKLCEVAAVAMKYAGKNPISLAKREAVIRILDTITATKDPKAWMDVYDSIWQPAPEDIKDLLDGCVALSFEKKPNITQSAAHKFACVSYPELTKANEPI